LKSGTGNDSRPQPLPATLWFIIIGDVSAEDEVKDLLDEAAGEPRLGSRVELVSARLLGRPYLINPLGGGPGLPEVLSVTLDGFDCVTYIETVLAVAMSRTEGEFTVVLRRMRYDGGRVDWFSRNHYMTDWVRNNEARGIVSDLTRGPEAVEKTRALRVVEGLPQKAVRFSCFPKRRLASVSRDIATGDLIFFVSARKWLDVFHTGLLVKSGDDILMRHATRARGEVVEQRLSEFMSDNRMSGFMLLRPVESR
jgi:hypothetical protein